MAKYNWLATYDDGTTVSQYNDNGTERGYVDLDHTRLKSFAICETCDDCNRTGSRHKKLFELHLDPDQRLIFRKRVFKHVSAEGTGDQVVLMVGWQQTVWDDENDFLQNIQAIAYVFPDGHVELAGAFREGHPVFDPPKKSVRETHLMDWPGCKD